METKTEGQLLAEKVLYETKSAWEKIDEAEKNKMETLSKEYIEFLNNAKTEREAVTEAVKLASQKGFVAFETLDAIKPNDKVYFINRNKSVVLAVIGKKQLEEGLNVVAAHIDSPRIDLKQNPVYEDSGLCLFKTHYYGGIKKYQWTAMPLAIHGVFVREDGTKFDFKIGEDDPDPIFTITDLLPHLAQDQMQKKMSEGIPGESLNLLVGSQPIKDEKAKDKIKLNILKILNEKYGIVERDFISAEIEIVPAAKARELGFDRSMIAGYGQDDRICSFASLSAILEIDNPEKTVVCILTDKEEIGSVGNTGMQGRYFEHFITEALEKQAGFSMVKYNKTLIKSKVLSADVNGAVDPSFDGVHEKRNAAFLGKGICITKFTGSRGKSGANDANAEFLSAVLRILDANKVAWQAAELGKVDQGGGGTIAYILANLGMEVLDCGTAVLSMHSTYEVSSKVDFYMTYKAYKVFLENM